MRNTTLRDALTGAVVYPAMELCFRGRTHPSMALAGAGSMCWLRYVKRKPLGLCRQALLGGAGITGIELTAGLLFNRDHRVWDYTKMPANLRGQVCLPYTLLWCGLSLPVLLMMKKH